jgi:hypothetical protein
MRAPTFLTLLALLAASLAMPTGQAHIENYSEADTVRVGPYSVFLNPNPYPIHEGSSVSLSALATDARSGRYATQVTMTIDVTDPSGNTRAVQLKPDGTGYLVGYVTLMEAGNHTAAIKLQDAEATHEGVTWIDVYPDLPVRIRPSNENFDAFAGVRATLAFEVVDARTYAPDTSLQDLRMRIEHWSDDHRTLLGEEELPMQRGSGSVWRTDYTFPAAGMFHMRFASDSGSFTYPDVPLLHVYATEAPPQETAKETPGPHALLAPLLVALALVAARSARRGRT